MSLSSASARPFLQPTVHQRKHVITPPSNFERKEDVSLQVDRFVSVPDEAANRFVVVGDAGTGKAPQYDVANQMYLWKQAYPFKRVLPLGDNVYKHGEPKDFDDRIYKPYQPLIDEGVEFDPVMGNHDVKYGHVEEQLKYWGVPAYYSFEMGPKGSEVEFFALDTTVLVPGDNGCYKKNQAEAEEKAKKQLAWLEESLAKSKAPMKVVYGHYPLFSLGAHAEEKREKSQKRLEKILAPLFDKYGVDLYMAGHEHHYEKPKRVNGTHYLVSGAGGKSETALEGVPEGNGVLKQLHFMLFDITPKGLSYRTISDQGKILDSGLIPRKDKLQVQQRPQPRANICRQGIDCLNYIFQGLTSYASNLSRYWPWSKPKSHTPEQMV